MRYPCYGPFEGVRGSLVLGQEGWAEVDVVEFRGATPCTEVNYSIQCSLLCSGKVTVSLDDLLVRP